MYDNVESYTQQRVIERDHVQTKAGVVRVVLSVAFPHVSLMPRVLETTQAR